LEKLENVPLNKITLIGGKNNTGKTTVLEALFLYLACNARDVLERILSWREFNGPWIPQEVWCKFFYNSDMEKEITVSIRSGTTKNEQMTVKFLANYETPVQFPVTENGVTTIRKNFPALEIIRSSNKIVDYNAYYLSQGNIYNYLKEIDSIQGQSSVFFMGGGMRLYHKNIEYFGFLDKADEQEKILPLLRILEPKLIRLQLINDGGHDLIYADFGDKKKIPVNMLGDGFCRCMTMALILATKNANVFLIDEIGAGIHYSVQEDLWNFLVKAAELYDCQVIATTHSYDTVKAFNNIATRNNPSDFSYIRLGKKDNDIKPYVFTSDTLSYSLSSALEVR
jgi:AAA15 family ATPase/GTPase